MQASFPYIAVNVGVVLKVTIDPFVTIITTIAIR